MGVDLRLLPLFTPNADIAHDMIDLGKDYDLWAAIKRLPQRDVAKQIHTFTAPDGKGGHEYGPVEVDAYGDRLKYVTAGDLVSLKDHGGVTSSPKKRAAWAYLAEMPAGWPIVLYWH